jgi:type I restriction enzyme S subunit
VTEGVLLKIKKPDGWDWQRLWSAAPRVQVVGQPEAEPLSVFLEAGVIPRASRADNHNQLGEDLSKYQVVRPGDIVFNKLRTWQGGLGASEYYGIVSPAYFVCRPSKEWHPRFLHHLLLSNVYLSELTRLSKFMPPSQFDIPWEALRALPLLRPPVAEQRQISEFLDVEIGRINKLIESQKRALDLIDERIDSQILELIGKSSLADANGMPSVPLRRLLAKRSRPTMATSEVITAFRDGQVTTRSVRRSEGYTLTGSDEPQGQGVQVGDIIIHGLDGFAGAIGESEADGNCSPVYHVCTPLDGGNSSFYGRLLRVLAVNDYLGLFAISTRERAVDLRNWDLLGRIPVPQIDLDIQHKIGSLVTSVRPLRQEAGRFIERLTERRQVLVTAAVTGQIDVTAVRRLSKVDGVKT